MFLSDFIKNNNLLQASASAGAINAGDITQLNAIAQAARVVCSDYAAQNAVGATPMAQQQYSAGSYMNSASNPRNTYVDTATGNIYVADINAAFKPQVWKFGPTGNLIASLQLNANVINGNASISVVLSKLSNGDFAAFWCEGASPSTPTFTIFDSDLFGVKFGPTAVGTSNANPNPAINMTPLSGGGFFLTWTWAGNGTYYAVYSNVGAVVKAATVVAGAPAQNSGTVVGMATIPRQLTSGNIAVGFVDPHAPDVAYAIYSPVGNVVVAYTSIVGMNAGTQTAYPELSILPAGYWAMTTGRSANATQQLVVFNDAGAQQGIVFSGTAGNGTQALTQDGTSFWLMTGNLGTSPTITRVGITGGASAVQTTLSSIALAAFPNGATAIKYDPDFGLLYIVAGTKALALIPQTTGKVLPVGGIVSLGASHTDQFVAWVGDGCIVCGNGGYIEVAKIIATAILGVCVQSVAAGNAGTPFLFNMGPGGFQVNPFFGSAGIAFDHSAAVPLGNKGTFVTGRSLSLKGI